MNEREEMQSNTRIQTDYHMHTTFSPDADNTPAEMCAQALTVGMRAIALTEHAEWHPASRSPFENTDDYFETVQACRAAYGPKGLSVLSGVEVGNPHQYADQARVFLAENNFDVVIGSIHWLGDDNIHLQEMFARRDATAIYTEYFTQMARMAAAFDLNFVAHFDRIFWPGITASGLPDMPALESVLRDTLATIAGRKQGLELNTRFLDSSANWNELLVQTLTWFREEGGMHVFVNSDAHRVREIGRNREIAQTLLREAGFATGSQLRDVMSVQVTEYA